MALGYKKTELAKLMDISRQTVYNYLNEIPQAEISRVKKIAIESKLKIMFEFKMYYFERFPNGIFQHNLERDFTEYITHPEYSDWHDDIVDWIFDNKDKLYEKGFSKDFLNMMYRRHLKRTDSYINYPDYVDWNLADTVDIFSIQD